MGRKGHRGGRIQKLARVKRGEKKGDTIGGEEKDRKRMRKLGKTMVKEKGSGPKGSGLVKKNAGVL